MCLLLKISLKKLLSLKYWMDEDDISSYRFYVTLLHNNFQPILFFKFRERLKMAILNSAEVTIHTKTQDTVSLLEFTKVQNKAMEKTRGKPKAKSDICYPHKYRVR